MDRRIAGAIAAWLVAFVPVAFPCTTFGLKSADGHVVGKSYDRGDGTGYLMVNKRGVEKTALLTPGASRAQVWTSKFGSVTFNQLARELPMGGLNEAGLAIEIMILGETRYPPATDSRPAVNESQWIQYMLDRFATVGEMLAHAPTIKIAPAAETVHYLACDKDGACASFEYIGGQLVTHSGDQFPEFVLTNSTASSSLQALRGHTGFGGDRAIPSDIGSISRFVRTAANARNYDGSDPQAYAFRMLDSVSMGNFSKWNIVYHTQTGRVAFRTASDTAVKVVDLDRLDFDCRTAVTVHDVQTSSRGNLSGSFSAYSEALNRELFRKAASALPITIPADLFEKVVTYPEKMTRCAQ